MVVRFHPLPDPGDIVWCRFPHTSAIPRLKPRPALVFGASPLDHEVEVAYGTSQKTDKVFAGEFVLDPRDAGFHHSGLAVRTKFDLARRQKLVFNSVWFAPASGVHPSSPQPLLGRLHDSYLVPAARALKRIS